MMEHTIGPWSFYWTEYGDGRVMDGVGNPVTNPFYNDNDNQTEANGRLISAAPELLNALEAMVAPFFWVSDEKLREYPDTPQPQAILRARAAITKARGKA